MTFIVMDMLFEYQQFPYAHIDKKVESLRVAIFEGIGRQTQV